MSNFLSDSVPASSAYIDVRSHGAVADGATNNTAAIQAAFNAAMVAGQALVDFAPGVYAAPGYYTGLGTGAYRLQLLLDGRLGLGTPGCDLTIRGYGATLITSADIPGTSFIDANNIDFISVLGQWKGIRFEGFRFVSTHALGTQAIIQAIGTQGSGYPTTAATITATKTGSAITALTVTGAGSGYNVVPTITIVGGGGSGATGTVTLGTGLAAGTIVSATITSGGTGYTGTPTVVISSDYSQLKGLVVKDCTFDSFGHAVGLIGCDTPRIQDCRFIYPNGRDSAFIGVTPAVPIYPSNNLANKQITRNPIIRDNYFNGCTGAGVGGNTVITSPVALDNRAAVDGLYNGYSAGASITGNTCVNFSVEGAFPLHDEASIDTTAYPFLISGNSFDCAVVPGSISPQNVGIRADAPNLNIVGNEIVNATNGIQVDGVSVHVAKQYYGGLIAANQIHMTPTPPATFASKFSLSIYTNNAQRLRIINNHIYWPTYNASAGLFNAGIYMSWPSGHTTPTSCQVDGNEIRCLARVGGQNLYAFVILGADTSTVFNNNTTENTDIVLFSYDGTGVTLGSWQDSGSGTILYNTTLTTLSGFPIPTTTAALSTNGTLFFDSGNSNKLTLSDLAGTKHVFTTAPTQ